MGEVAIQVVKWVVRSSIIMSVILAFIVLFNLTTSLFSTALNFNMVSDLLSLMQLWLPFDLSVIMAWAITASIVYISYRLALFTADIVNKFIS